MRNNNFCKEYSKVPDMKEETLTGQNSLQWNLSQRNPVPVLNKQIATLCIQDLKTVPSKSPYVSHLIDTELGEDLLRALARYTKTHTSNEVT